jgi:hypothetical protein
MRTTDPTAATALTDAWLDRFFEALYDRDPVSATFIGVHDRDHRLPDRSEHGAGDALAEMQAQRATAPDPDAAGLSDAQRLDLTLAGGCLAVRLREFESRHFHRGNPSVYTSEAVFGTLALFMTPFAPLGERVASAVERLRAVRPFLAQGRENVRSAPAAWTERARRECTGALAFLRGGVDLLMAAEGIRDGRLRAAADDAADAFVAYDEHLRALPATADDRYGAGEEMLELVMADGHHLDGGANAVAERAESELAAAEARLAEGARSLGFDGAEKALAALTDAHPPVERYLDRYAEEWAAARAAAEAHGLVTWPDFPVRFVPRPVWSRAAAPHLYFLFYRSPAAFGRPPVHEHLATPIDASLAAPERARLLRENSDAVIRLNHVIHHAGIGHHVQNWHAFRAASRIGRIAAVDCASRIALPCGGTMAEGWACYATDLMREIGYLTPLEVLAEERSRARMCTRALVDVRLHQHRLSLDAAAALYERRAGMSAAAARAEAVRNSMNPGMALMYMAGRDAIHDLRGAMRARAGARFDLRAFHDGFLSFGSVPVTRIARRMLDEETTVA